MLLEREESLTILTTQCSEAARHHGCIALVHGEAGIGKTTLLETLSNQLSTRYQFYWGRCDALFTPRPLGPLHDMAPQFNAHIRQQLIDQTESSQLFASVFNQLSQSSKGAVLIFEDVHWADNATLDFLNFLVRRISLLPALLILSYRDDEVHCEHPLTNVLGLLPTKQTTRIHLEPLSRKAIADIITTSKYSADEFFTITGGNPFFVTELMEFRSESGSIPVSIKDAINARLIRLSELERKLLETISVIPGRLHLNSLTNLFGDQAETLAMACVGRKLLLQDSEQNFRFRHELTRLAILSRLSALQQKDIHRKVLEALLEHFSENDINSNLDHIVHHAAGAAEVEAVLKYAPLAAKKASAVGAHKEAAAHFSTALRFVDQATSEIAAGLYENWAFEASLALRIDDQVLEALRIAITLRRSLGQLENVGKNLRLLSRLHWLRGEGIESIRYVDEAIKVLESIPPCEELAMAYSVRSQSHLVNDRMDDAIAWGEKALALALKYKSEEVQIHALNNVGTARIFRNEEQGVLMLEQSLQLALVSGRHVDAARAYANLADYFVEFRHFAKAETVLADGITFTHQHDMIAKANYLQGYMALLRLEQGRLRDAYTISKGILHTKGLNLLARLPAMIVYAKAKMRLGKGCAKDLLLETLNEAAQTEELQFIFPIHLALVELAWLENDMALANEHFQYLINIDRNLLHPWWCGELVIWARRFNFSIADNYVNDLPQPYQLELNSQYQAAENCWHELKMPYAAALCAMKKNVSEHDVESVTNLKNSLVAMDASPVMTKLANLCNAVGLGDFDIKSRRGPYRSAKNHPIGLTKREQEILGLLAKGASNKEISNVLVRSTRTIENHVSTILTKLNAKNRLEAMLRVHNEPWLLPE